MTTMTMASASDVAGQAPRLLGLTLPKLRAARALLKRFEKFCEHVTTVQGEPFVLEPFQRLILLAYFAGFSEILILIPKGNGKTTLLAALAIFHLLTTPYPEAYIGASTKGQADKMYLEACRIMDCRAAWRKRLIKRAATREIRVSRDASKGRLVVLASDKLDKGFSEGIAPTLGLIDELHAHVNDAIYSAIHGALHKRGGQMLTISTAGDDEESLLGRMREVAHQLRQKLRLDRLTVARAGNFVMFEWALLPSDDPEDIDAVKAANPASFVTKAALRALRASPSMKAGRWARYHGNRWGIVEGRWMEPEIFDACERRFDVEDGELLVLGLDFARTFDHASLIGMHPTVPGEGEEGAGRGRVFPIAHWKPEEEDGGKIPFWKVKQGIRDACKRWAVVGVGYDKNGGFAQSAEELEDEGIPMIEISMGSAVWAPLTAELEAAFVGERLEHNGDAELRKHFLAAETKDSEHGERLHGKPKGKTKRKMHVDAVIGTGCAWYLGHMTDLLEGGSEVGIEVLA